MTRRQRALRAPLAPHVPRAAHNVRVLPLTPSNRAKPASYSSLRYRGYPCPRKCETHGGVHIQLSSSLPPSPFPVPLSFTFTVRCFGSLLVISIVPCAAPFAVGLN